MSSAENGKPAGRLVHASLNQRDWLDWAIGRLDRPTDTVACAGVTALRALRDAWDAAPADPAEAARALVTSAGIDSDCDLELVNAVLQALGVPSSSPTRSDNP